MLDRTASKASIDRPALERVDARVAVAVKRGADGASTVLDRVHQGGAGKVRFPRPDQGRPFEAVLVNLAGGLTDGDRFDVAATWAAGTRAAITTQAAEKVYRARSEPAVLTTRLSVGAGARAEWLPQETILFDGSSLDRSLDVDVAADGRLTAVESVVLGRTAMGESVVRGAFVDRWRIRRDGRLVYADTARLGGDIAALRARHAVLAGARAFATIVDVAPDAAERLDAVRAAAAAAAGEVGASAWNGLVVIRCVAPDGAMLRRDLVMLLGVVRGTALPRVWMT